MEPTSDRTPREVILPRPFDLVAARDMDAVGGYLSSGGAVDVLLDDEITLLWFATEFSSPEIVERLIKAGSDINHVVRHVTPLEHAIRARRFDNAQKLLELGADASKRCLDQSSAVELAVAARNFQIASKLIEDGYSDDLHILRGVLDYSHTTESLKADRDRLIRLVDEALASGRNNRTPRHCDGKMRR